MDDQRQKGIHLSDDQRLNWLRLIRSNNVGPATFRELINHCGSAERAIEMLPELSRRGGSRKKIEIASVEEAETELEQISKFGARLIGIGEPEYPSALRQIEGAPPLLTVKGNLSITPRPSVGIVGSRNGSISGNKFAKHIAAELTKEDYIITSGLARGIDASAHIASLGAGTVAALAGGIDRPYPPENVKLYERICEGDGLAITEMKFGWKPIARDFPRRNRLIAGISMGLLVVEAAMRSGSLITARNAAEFGRLVFAVPGSPYDPRSAGTNALLKDGAILTTNAQDLLGALAPLVSKPTFQAETILEETEDNQTGYSAPDESARSQIIDAMGATPVEIDEIIRQTEQSAQTVYFVLLELDLAGRLQRHPGGLVSFIYDT